MRRYDVYAGTHTHIRAVIVLGVLDTIALEPPANFALSDSKVTSIRNCSCTYSTMDWFIGISTFIYDYIFVFFFLFQYTHFNLQLQIHTYVRRL